jgi:hypothetical protein
VSVCAGQSGIPGHWASWAGTGRADSLTCGNVPKPALTWLKTLALLVAGIHRFSSSCVTSVSRGGRP